VRQNTQNLTYITIRIHKVVKEYIKIKIHNLTIRIQNLHN